MLCMDEEVNRHPNGTYLNRIYQIALLSAFMASKSIIITFFITFITILHSLLIWIFTRLLSTG
jgi:hypothetical protein